MVLWRGQTRIDGRRCVSEIEEGSRAALAAIVLGKISEYAAGVGTAF
jgi:hypothetical protein